MIWLRNDYFGNKDRDWIRMALDTFLKCCFPYTLQREGRGYWLPMNREHLPLGFAKEDGDALNVKGYYGCYNISYKEAKKITVHKNSLEFENYWNKGRIYIYIGGVYDFDEEIIERLKRLSSYRAILYKDAYDGRGLFRSVPNFLPDELFLREEGDYEEGPEKERNKIPSLLKKVVGQDLFRLSERFLKEDSPLGDLANDIHSDFYFPKGGTYEQQLMYLYVQFVENSHIYDSVYDLLSHLKRRKK